MDKMKQKIMDWYEEHEEGVKVIGMMTVGTVLTYAVITPFMVLWNKLGLFDQN